jgi:hypothetical protein
MLKLVVLVVGACFVGVAGYGVHMHTIGRRSNKNQAQVVDWPEKHVVNEVLRKYFIRKGLGWDRQAQRKAS